MHWVKTSDKVQIRCAVGCVLNPGDDASTTLSVSQKEKSGREKDTFLCLDRAQCYWVRPRHYTQQSKTASGNTKAHSLSALAPAHWVTNAGGNPPKTEQSGKMTHFVEPTREGGHTLARQPANQQQQKSQSYKMGGGQGWRNGRARAIFQPRLADGHCHSGTHVQKHAS